MLIPTPKTLLYYGEDILDFMLVLLQQWSTHTKDENKIVGFFL
jgi:hypothetical protein